MDGIQGTVSVAGNQTQLLDLNQKSSLRVEAADNAERESCRPVKIRHCGGESGQGLEPDAALNYRRSEKTSLFIRTQEGDVVRLRVKQYDAMSASVQIATDGEKEISSLDVQAKSATRIAIFVKGDLNDDELAAIQSVVEQAASLAGQFYSGDTAEAFGGAAQLDIDGQQLAKVALRMSVREMLSYEQSLPQLPLPAAPAAVQVLAAPAPEAAPTTAAESEPGTSAEQAAATAPVTVASDPAPIETAAPAEETGAEEAASAEDAAPATESASSPTAEPWTMLGQVFSFLSQLIAELSPPTLPAATEPEATTEDTGSSANVSFSLKLRIFSSIMASFSVTAPESAPADLEVAGTELLNDTVETMAAASEAEIEEQV